MRIYLDSSALLKRVFDEAESVALRLLLTRARDTGDLLTASRLAWVEVWRAIRRAGVTDVTRAADEAFAGIAAHRLTEGVLTRAREIGPQSIRSLDAIHLAAAIDVGATTLVTYDGRLAEAATALGLAVIGPT